MDVKKLITSFLIVAAAVGSSALFLSVVVNTGQTTSPQIISPLTAPASASTTVPSIGQNAFVPQSDSYAAAQVTDVTSTPDDPNNLTDVLADSFMDNLANTNADGLATDADGNPTITAPDPNAIASDVASSSALENIQIPNWDTEAAAQKLKISSDSSPDADEAYINSLNNIFNQYLGQNGLANTISQDSDSDDTANAADITDADAAIGGALTDLSNTETPRNLVDLQESLIKVLVYEENASNLLAMASSDPVQASLIYQSEESQYNAATQDLQNQVQNVATQNLLSDNDGGSAAAPTNGLALVLEEFMGIKVANAQLATHDPILTLVTVTNQNINFSHQLWKELQDVLLQILKNTLITFIQRRALQWVTGGSTPRFIQQWGVQLINTGFAAANQAINSLAQCVYPAFQQPLVTTLQIYYKTSAGGAASCPVPPLQTALGGYSLQQFSSNFMDGGWSAFGATLLPSGNIYGTTFFGAQTADAAAQTAQTAKTSQSISGQGFTGDSACDDESNPTTGTHLACLNPANDTLFDAYPSTSCPSNYKPEQVPNWGLCADGSEPMVTTPAQVTNQGLSSAIGSNIKQVVSAKNLVGILASMVNSLFNSLMQVAISSVTGAINSGLNSAGSNPAAASQTATLSAEASSTSPTVQAVTCTPTQEQLSLTIASSTQASGYFGATGGAADQNGNEPTYTWTALGGTVTPATGSGVQFAPTYTVTTPGTYTYSIQVTGSTGGTATCQVQITAQ